MFLTTVCKALNDAKIGYAVVGGYAVALHGAVRGTVDLDLVIQLTEESFLKSEIAFKKLGLQSRLPVDAKQVFQFREDYIKNRNLIAWSFYDPTHPANQLDVIITDDFAKMKTDPILVHGVKVPLVSIQDLIQMKTRSGRPQDLEDISALRGLALRGLKEK